MIRRRPLLALRHRDFRNLWGSQLVSITGSQMQVVAINWQIYLLTGSPLALGLVGLTRVVPIILFSLLGGVVADRHDRKRVMLLTQTTMTLVAIALALLTVAGQPSVGVIYALNAVSAAAIAFDSPARQSLVPRLVPPDDLQGALALNLTIFHLGVIAGPALAGLLIAGTQAALVPSGAAAAGASASTAGIAAVYALNALSFVGVLVALATLRTSGRPDGAVAADTHPVDALRAGLRYVNTTTIMVWTMLLDFFATFFSGAMSLLPIFADKVLGTGPAGYGLLVAAPGLGALLGSLYTSVVPLPRRQGRVLLWAVAAYGAATVVFGISRSFLLTFAALAAGGVADLVSTVIRQTLRQLKTPDALRGRMTSVNMIFFTGGPQLGELEAGLVASLFASVSVGVTVSVVSGGVATLLVAAAVAGLSPVVRRYRG